MKITFVLPTTPRAPVGGFGVVYEYANQFVSMGHAVQIVYQSWRLPLRAVVGPHMAIDQLRTVARDFARPERRVAWFELNRSVRESLLPLPMVRGLPKADVIVATSWETAFLVSRAPRSAGRKFQLIQHYEIWSGDRKHVDDSFKLPLRKIVIAKWLGRKAKELEPGSDPAYIPNGLPHDRFFVTKPLSERGTDVISQYNPASFKAPQLLLDAMNELSLAGLRLCVFGAYPRPTGLLPGVRYHESPTGAALRDLYNDAAIYACFSEAEGWHLPPAEAMACGCAVVSRAIDGVADYADPGTAVLVDSAVCEDFVAAIKGLLQDWPRLECLANAGNARVQAFTWSRAAQSFLGVIAT